MLEDNPVAKQYEKWVYPPPIMDLNTPEARSYKDGGDPDLLFYTYWPDQDYRNNLDILVAGCGSNAAARYAFNHPQARVTGLDLSSASLAHEAYLKEKHQLRNLSLYQGQLENISTLQQSFDFIDVSGVLHHLGDPVAGLKALAQVLRPQGTIAVMVYGQYGRSGVYMLQEMFRMMGLGQNEHDLTIVKQALDNLPRHHILQNYIQRDQDVLFDAGLVDTFLHPQDQAFTVSDCLKLVSQAGLKFMGWWDNLLYYPEGQLKMNSGLYQRLEQLKEQTLWQLMEIFNGSLGQHAFCVCRPERPENSYKIDFRDDRFLDYVPVMRSQVVQEQSERITLWRQPYPACTLDQGLSAFVGQIDGKRTIAECLQRLLPSLDRQRYHPKELARYAFRCLWRKSDIFLRLPSESRA